MRLEIDYTVLNEHFNFSGYVHSFYSPHFSINYEKTSDSLSVFLTSYPRKLNLISMILNIKLQDNIAPTFDFVDSDTKFESGIILKSDAFFHSFYSPDETDGVTEFSFSEGYLIIKRKFCGKSFSKGTNRILFLKELKGTFSEVVRFNFSNLSYSRPSAWIPSNFRKKPVHKKDFYEFINKISSSILIPDYIFLDELIEFPNSNSKEIYDLKSNFEFSNISYALSIPLFLIKKNSYMHEKSFKKVTIPISENKFYKDFVLLDPNDGELLKFLKDEIYKYLSSGISMLKFDDLYPTMKFYDFKWKILDFLRELINFIKIEFPNAKLIIDIPPNYFSSNADFIQLQNYIKLQGTFFKSFKINRIIALKTILSIFSLYDSTNFVFPIPSFSVDIPSEEERYFVSIMNYIFSSIIFFNGDISLYSREEVSIFKKMLRVPPNIKDIDYDRGLFKISFFTDDDFILYINLSKDAIDINSFKIKPLSLSIFDKEKTLRKWPFKGW